MSVPIRPWEAPEITGWRRLPPHAVPRAASGDRLPLDGTWRFQLLPHPDAPLATDGRWARAEVPGCWTMQDVDDLHGVADLPHYTNVAMPWPDPPPRTPRRNPTGVYERAVTVPAGWAGRRVVLHVGAAESVLIARVNGEHVGVGKDSHLASEFDVTHAVRPGEPNAVRLTVVKWSDASFVEDQDQWWHGGITRPVFLYATDPLHLADVRVTAGLLPPATGNLCVDVRVRHTGGALPEGWTVSARLADGTELAPDAGFAAETEATDRHSGWLGRAVLSARVPAIRPWSAETPALHELTVRLHHPDGSVADTSRHRIGFRRVEIHGADLLVNGVRVLLRGVNRHDFHPLTGRVVTAEEMRADLATMKRFGFNAVRTAHYPNDPALLDLADELGLYVVAEANIEAHDHAHELADDPAYLGAFLDRVARMVHRDANHPCVIAWSLGNESDDGANHAAAAGWLRHEDPTRPVQYEGAIKYDWEGGHAASDILCPMYPSLDEIVAHATSGRQTRPLIMCEYSHAMGNSNGTLAEHWAAIEATPGLQGGFVWEFWDHGLLQRLSDGRPAGRAGAGAGAFAGGVAAPGHRWAYGGDFGDTPNDGTFCADGLVFPDRTPKPAMYEHRELAAPVRLELLDGGSRDGVRVRLHNRQHVRDLSWLAGEWHLAVDGRPDRPAPAALPHLPPGSTATVPIPAELLAGLGGDADAHLTLRLTTADDEPWAPRGTEVCTPQLCLAPERRPLRARAAAASATPDGATSITVDDEGLLVHRMLAAPPVLSLWRAPTDNDRAAGLAARWREQGLAGPRRVPVSVTRDGERVVVRAEYAVGAAGADRVVHLQAFTPLGPAGVLIEEEAFLPASLTDVPRVGTVLETAGGLDRVEWFGQGPWETYPDRCAGGPVGRYRAAVEELFTPYLRPQESGGRHGVRRLALTASDGGKGMEIHLDAPRQASVSRYRAADLDAAAHHDELVPRPVCVVHLDAAHRGLGTASCGPDTLPPYLVGPGTYRWSWALITLGG